MRSRFGLTLEWIGQANDIEIRAKGNEGSHNRRVKLIYMRRAETAGPDVVTSPELFRYVSIHGFRVMTVAIPNRHLEHGYGYLPPIRRDIRTGVAINHT